MRGARAGVLIWTNIPMNLRWTWPGVCHPSGRGLSQGSRTSLTSAWANHSCQQALAISHLQRSAASAWRGRTVVQPRLVFANRKACSTVKRPRYHRQTWWRSSGSWPPIQASHSGAGRPWLRAPSTDRARAPRSWSHRLAPAMPARRAQRARAAALGSPGLGPFAWPRTLLESKHRGWVMDASPSG